ncbi:GrlR family regulatory protein [Pseudomonas sp. Irchel 3A5]|uniref:GrlR family regulatory protein n=1 Tax=Pseudomonas sp. Irchel 3A5 TaxID=2008911 RepID=UPI000BA3DBD0|nr:GrlR family regulatory protein [Pseudomonas sp. Irchel 3A5]
MANGIFHVDFRASTGDHGDGLVVVKDGAVNGGDPNYLYQGKVPNESGPFESNFTVRKWREGNTNVVGLDDYTLLAKGQVNYEAGTIELEGAVVGAPQLTIQLKGRKIQDAV